MFGSFYYLFNKVYGIEESRIFLYLYVPYVLYFFFFVYVVNLKTELDSLDIISRENQGKCEEQEATINKKLSITIIPEIMKKIYYSIFFGIVYFCEYSIFGFLAEIAGKKQTDKRFTAKYAYPMIQCSYQIGVFASRSSLQLFKIRLIKVLCGIQFILFCAWIGFATFIDVSVGWLFACVFIVGIVAGLTYVNTVYMILNDKTIDKSEKEVCLNVNAMFSDSGIILSSIFGFVFKRILVPS